MCRTDLITSVKSEAFQYELKLHGRGIESDTKGEDRKANNN